MLFLEFYCKTSVSVPLEHDVHSYSDQIWRQAVNAKQYSLVSFNAMFVCCTQYGLFIPIRRIKVWNCIIRKFVQFIILCNNFPARQLNINFTPEKICINPVQCSERALNEVSSFDITQSYLSVYVSCRGCKSVAGSGKQDALRIHGWDTLFTASYFGRFGA